MYPICARAESPRPSPKYARPPLKWSKVAMVEAVTAGMVVGEVENLWDACAIVEYPSIKAFMNMVDSDEWGQHAVHREAGLEGQLNIFSRTPPG